MKCPFCGKDAKVVDTRQKDDNRYRRYECLNCRMRFNTIETYNEDFDIEPVKAKKETKLAVTWKS